MAKKQKLVDPNNLTEKQKKKLEKQEQIILKQRERKIIVLDNFNKKILNFVLAILILSILVPVLVFSFVKPTKIVDLTSDKGTTFYTQNYNREVNSLSIEYTQTDVLYIKDYLFKNGQIVEKTITTITDSSNIAVVVRKLSMLDKEYIKANIAGMKDSTDQTIQDYLSTSTEYIEITNTLVNYEYEITNQQLKTKTFLETDGTTYEEIYSNLGFNGVISQAKAKIRYNAFGIGYTYMDYILLDELGNELTFKGKYVSSLKAIDSGIEYSFAINNCSKSYKKLNNLL